MTLREHIFLTWNYGRGLILTGGVYNLVYASGLMAGFSYEGLIDAFIIKLPLVALAYLLFRSARQRDADFFYINLGISPKRLIISVLVFDFLMLAIMLIIVVLANGGKA